MPADRDFELTWKPALGRLPRTTLLTEEFGGDLYALLMLLPPDASTGGDLRLPRETIFVVDTSGSMSGESIEQAKQSLLFALERLRPRGQLQHHPLRVGDPRRSTPKPCR